MKFLCRVCNSTKIKNILNLGNQPWGNDFIKIKENKVSRLFPLNFVICEDCKTCQIDYTIPKENMFVNHSYMSGTTKTLTKHFENVGCNIQKKITFSDNDYILDIGGNDGTFLKYFKSRNINVLNVDSGNEQSKISNKNNIECINKFFDAKLAKKILQDKNKCLVIHGSGIFFHLEDLKSVFEGIKYLMKDNGILVAEFIYLPQMIKNLAFDQIYHEHLLYYSLNSFQKLLNQFDLELFDAQMSDIHGGSCVSYIKHKKDNREISANLKDFLKAEIEEGFEDYDVYYNFADKVNNLKKKMREIILDLKSKKKKIFALGAPVKGSTLINFMELREDIIECAVEINKHKFGTYYPGTRIPVLDQNKTNDPDYYLFLSWNFKDEIISKMDGYVKNGGKFIIPFPNIEII